MKPSQQDKSIHSQDQVPLLSKITELFLWITLFTGIGLLVYYLINTPVWNLNNVFIINGFTLIIWITVAFFSAIISTYSKNYLKGFRYHKKFTTLCLGFTISVFIFVMSNHVAPFLLSWLLMGIFIAQLIGVDKDWGEAKEASKFAQKYFFGGTVLLSIGLLTLAYFTNDFTLTGIIGQLNVVPNIWLVVATLCIIVAALIQSAIYPFHRWLLSAMTAPTPASALMHAGFVNGSGILLTITASMLIASNTLTLLFIIGGLTAIIAQFTKLLQVNVKQKLGCSTIAQMGFMIMQCGLGFFNAAIAHLILHGFYKAYLFLSSGEEILHSAPEKAHKIKIKPMQAFLVLVFGVAGAILFSYLTGKINTMDSSIFLILIVAITVGQATYNIVKEKSISVTEKTFVPILLFTFGIVLYALLYNGITYVMADLPMMEVPQSLSVLQIVFGIIFIIGFFIMKLGIYKKVPWLYVKLLNISQPHHKTILNYKNVTKMKSNFLNNITSASDVVGKTWPLYSFVTSNPLSGYENFKFSEAVTNAEKNLGANVYPKAAEFREAWESGKIDKQVLIALLSKSGMQESPSFYLEQLEAAKTENIHNKNHHVDRIMVKWLSVFMDEGLAEWEMPNKAKGFYKSWRALAIYDEELGKNNSVKIPADSEAALEEILARYSNEEQLEIFKYNLAALPGWTGYIKHRVENNTLWQQKYSITLLEYLAVRLCVAKCLHVDIKPLEFTSTISVSQNKLKEIWLKAWEQSWQEAMVKRLHTQQIITDAAPKTKLPSAQLVFCIDTRSELIRRNVETKGNYETFGYAGFFGIAMDYKNREDGLIRKSCPPIVNSAYNVLEKPQENKKIAFKNKKKEFKKASFKEYFLKRMKNMLPSAFGYVEGAGLFYGASLIARTLIPASLYKPDKNNEIAFENHCEPKLVNANNDANNDKNIPIADKIGIVKSAFDLLGWTEFSPLIIFAGHGSHSVNNAFASSLDCGACAASPGRHNARMLAKMANLSEVKEGLKTLHNIEIPNNTIFIGAEHNTTTDEIVLFDSQVPNSHLELLNQLKSDLKIAQETATTERLGISKDSIAAVHFKTNNWSETRPEWGLAKNAGFVIGSRKLTKDLNLNGHCFLHSYDWQLDVTGAALQGIMQGPMVVTQWINNHYYFSTVDNNQFGGGTKITHNITGRFGVVQGNGGDLKIGLPLQSVNESDDTLYHSPLRLSVLIHAPKERVIEILKNNPNLQSLIDNQWIYLLVINPNNNNKIERYEGKDLGWSFFKEEKEAEKEMSNF